MNRLIIIGNGFDLAHGLKTSYGDFMNDYFIESFDKITPINKSSSSNPMFEIYEVNSQNTKFFFEDDLLELTVFFKKKKNFSNKSSLYEELNNWNTVIRSLGYEYCLNNPEYRIEISSEFPFVDQLLQDIQTKKWVDIEAIFFSHLKNSLINQDNLIGLNAELTSIQEKLSSYLVKQLCEIDRSLIEYAQMKQILFPEESKGEVCVLNFNYTNTIEHYLEEENSNVIYIHGKIGDEKNPIIFGYGDDHHEDYVKLQEAGNDELLKHQKSMLYPRTDNYARMEYFLESSVEEGFEVLILGHSCGLSDRTLLRTIFEHKNCKKIHIAFHKDVNDFDSKVIAISRHFNDKTKMRSRVAPFNEELRIPQFKEYEA